MIERISYYAQRIREAGLRHTASKLQQKVRPFTHWPSYAVSGWPRTGETEREAMRAFGKLCSRGFLNAAQIDPGRLVRVAQRLEVAECGRIPILGFGELAKPNGAGWHVDPLHGHRWELRYFPRCDFLAPHVRTDVKIPWEFSRLQWLVWVAEAAVNGQTAQQDRLKALFLATIQDWARANPAGYGVNWTCGMEVAIRAVNLALASGAMAALLADPELDWICSILRAHQQYLARFPEISDVAGNHYLTDLMGEVVLHAALDTCGSASSEQAFERFAQAANEQFELGGCHIERATIYHRLTHDIVSLPYALALRAGSPSAATLADVLKRSGQFMAQIADDTGHLPVIGDQDSGFVIWFGETAQVADKRICKADRAPLTDLYSFLGALAGDEAFFPEFEREIGSRSGFATVAGGGFRTTMKTGPIGLGGRAAHDHDDALSLTASHLGCPVLIDPGCHSYTLDPALRREFILSSKHNSPIPRGAERHSPVAGSINATVRGAPTAALLAWSEDEMQGRIAPTNSSEMEVLRLVKITNGNLAIEDRWTFKDSASAQVLWLFDPTWDLRGEIAGDWIGASMTTLTLQSNTGKLTVAITIPGGGRLKYYRERYSPDYGALAECWALHVETVASRKGTARLSLSANS